MYFISNSFREERYFHMRFFRRLPAAAGRVKSNPRSPRGVEGEPKLDLKIRAV
jgi:hypothetical protein